ncbi:MAG: hypothetical protein L0219_09415, partial [Phycisphaerales bacterium]|nr:hypothetical protein [Phycisphaerales bacterium]
GMRRLSAELQSLGATPLSEGLDNLWQRVKLWTGGGSPQDDVSVVALEISEDPSFNDHTDASGRVGTEQPQNPPEILRERAKAAHNAAHFLAILTPSRIR